MGSKITSSKTSLHRTDLQSGRQPYLQAKLSTRSTYANSDACCPKKKKKTVYMIHGQPWIVIFRKYVRMRLTASYDSVQHTQRHTISMCTVKVQMLVSYVATRRGWFSNQDFLSGSECSDYNRWSIGQFLLPTQHCQFPTPASQNVEVE
jgi:hypothetical protein